MVIFRQKVYTVDPEKVSINSSGDYQSSIINSGGTSGTKNSTVSGGSVIQATNQIMSSALPGQNIKVILEANSIKARQDKIEMSGKRAEMMRQTRVSATNQAKKQSSLIGIRDARVEERKKNTKSTNVYKVPTIAKSPISSNNRTMIKK